MVVEKTQEVRELANAITQITNPEKQTAKTPAPPPYAKQQNPPGQPPPYQKAPNPPLADMHAPNSPQAELLSQLEIMRDLAGGKKGGK
jgi:hypothetical protein